jgi:hypothetical protein
MIIRVPSNGDITPVPQNGSSLISMFQRAYSCGKGALHPNLISGQTFGWIGTVSFAMAFAIDMRFI